MLELLLQPSIRFWRCTTQHTLLTLYNPAYASDAEQPNIRLWRCTTQHTLLTLYNLDNKWFIFPRTEYAAFTYGYSHLELIYLSYTVIFVVLELIWTSQQPPKNCFKKNKAMYKSKKFKTSKQLTYLENNAKTTKPMVLNITCFL